MCIIIRIQLYNKVYEIKNIGIISSLEIILGVSLYFRLTMESKCVIFKNVCVSCKEMFFEIREWPLFTSQRV